MTRVQAFLTGNLQLASLRPSSPDGLTFSYNRQQEQFKMYGDLKATVPSTGGKPTSITATLGDQAHPGLVIKGGEPQSLKMSLSGQFDVFGLTVEVSGEGLVRRPG